MEENKNCLCNSSDARVVSCSGTSNVGQMANQAAIELAKKKVAGFFCLAGVEPISKEWSNPERRQI
jgi:uncharacterized metal-binding protein